MEFTPLIPEPKVGTIFHFWFQDRVCAETIMATGVIRDQTMVNVRGRTDDWYGWNYYQPRQALLKNIYNEGRR